MMLTPRQIWAFLQFSNVEKAHQLHIDAIAAQGDGEQIKKISSELNASALQDRNR